MWQVESLRITAFLVSPVDIENINWWEEVVNSKPELDQINRKVGQRVQEGGYSNGVLGLSISPQRVDWRFVPLSSPDSIFPRLGGVEDKFPEFIGSMLSWIENCNGINRLAFGVVVIDDKDDHSACYQFLNELLPEVQVNENTYDFLYQINRPRIINVSDIKNIKINRLSKWNALKGGRADRDSNDEEKKFYVARLELDINTDADQKSVLPIQSLPELINLFAAFAQEIIVDGDIV